MVVTIAFLGICMCHAPKSSRLLFWAASIAAVSCMIVSCLVAQFELCVSYTKSPVRLDNLSLFVLITQTPTMYRNKSQNSTAQRNQLAQSHKESTGRSECDNSPSKQTELARASTCRGGFTQHAEFPKRAKKSKFVRPIKVCN